MALTSVGLTNNPIYWATPSKSTTKLDHSAQGLSLTLFPFFSAYSLKREFSILHCATLRSSPSCTAFIHQQMCPLSCPPLLISRMMQCSPLPVKNSLVWALGFILCLFSSCASVFRLSSSRISDSSQSINTVGPSYPWFCILWFQLPWGLPWSESKFSFWHTAGRSIAA